MSIEIGQVYKSPSGTLYKVDSINGDKVYAKLFHLIDMPPFIFQGWYFMESFVLVDVGGL